MPRPPMDWLIADTHFFHKKMVTEWKVWPKGFSEKIVGNLVRLVAEQDLLIHLGDVILYQYPQP